MKKKYVVDITCKCCHSRVNSTLTRRTYDTKKQAQDATKFWRKNPTHDVEIRVEGTPSTYYKRIFKNG